MSFSLFAIYECAGEDAPALANLLSGAVSQCDNPDLERVDLFVPEPAETILFDDGPAPGAVLEFSCASGTSLSRLAAGDDFQHRFHQAPGDAIPGLSMTFGLFRRSCTPVAGADVPAPRTAGLSFMVRYYGPTDDAAVFQAFYTRNHPPILGRLPEIRNVACYLPESFDASNLPRSEIILVNEVVFDDIAGLNTALASDVVGLLKADSARFPPFGHSTHHAMRRRSLLSEAIG